jgi:hypothetical protein
LDRFRGGGGGSVLHDVSIREPAQSGRRNGCSFPGTQERGQTRRVVFPKLVVCFNCGFTEFSIPESELRRLVEIDSTGALLVPSCLAAAPIVGYLVALHVSREGRDGVSTREDSR